MERLSFMTGSRKIIRFTIDNKVITYYDDLWEDGVQFMPKDQNLIEKLLRSGKSQLKILALELIKANSGKELQEYEKCNTDKELAEFIRKDCRDKGLVEIKLTRR